MTLGRLRGLSFLLCEMGAATLTSRGPCEIKGDDACETLAGLIRQSQCPLTAAVATVMILPAHLTHRRKGHRRPLPQKVLLYHAQASSPWHSFTRRGQGSPCRVGRHRWAAPLTSSYPVVPGGSCICTPWWGWESPETHLRREDWSGLDVSPPFSQKCQLKAGASIVML